MTAEFAAWTEWAEKCAAVKSSALAAYYAARRSETTCADEKSSAAMLAADFAARENPECARLKARWEQIRQNTQVQPR